MSEEGQIYEEPQQTSQDTEVRTVDSTNTKMPDVDLSQKEKTLERSDKGKGLAIQTPFSSKDKSPMEDTTRWFRKEVMTRHKRQLYCTEEEGMRELVEALKKPKPPVGDVRTLAFVMINQN